MTIRLSYFDGFAFIGHIGQSIKCPMLLSSTLCRRDQKSHLHIVVKEKTLFMKDMKSGIWFFSLVTAGINALYRRDRKDYDYHLF